MAWVLASHDARAGDPYIRWHTLRTPHFRVHYTSGLESVAQHVATAAEEIHERVSAVLAWTPDDVTHVAITDDTDDANGSASSLPYNAIRLFATAPEDMEPLAEYDDWLVGLLTHEHSHILHVDNLTGLPALANAVIGKTLAPNQAQPRWVLEGLATWLETELTSGGRLRSSQFDMLLRMDVVEGNFARLDQISNDSRRWPGGTLAYLYGGFFIQWIANTYGKHTLAAVAADYGSNPIPWGLNRSIRRATGTTYPDLYRAWQMHLLRRYSEQLGEVERRGRREGTRLTFDGGDAASPRFVPSCALGDGDAGPAGALVYYRDDWHSTAGLYRLPLAGGPTRATDAAELLVRTQGSSTASFDTECAMIYDSRAISGRYYRYNDLLRLPRGTRSTLGLDPLRQRVTRGMRAKDPSVSPSGKHIAFVTGRLGTSRLMLGELSSSGALGRRRPLMTSLAFEQVYTPRFSPDGRHVAVSAWKRGGFRDIFLVEIATGRVTRVTHDRALDLQPTFSPDGRALYFSSDRTGIANIYRFELQTGRLQQVTNVFGGAYMPEVSPDGGHLIYVGYGSRGYDLYSIELDASEWLSAVPPPSRPRVRRIEPRPPYPVEPYRALPTLRPRAFEFEYAPGAYGESISLGATGEDIASLHRVALRVTTGPEMPCARFAAHYAYTRLRVTMNAGVQRTCIPRGGFRYGGDPEAVDEMVLGATSAMSFRLPSEFGAQSVSLGYSVSDHDARQPIGTAAEPDSPRTQAPFQGFLGAVRVAYSYSGTQRSPFSVSDERGVTLDASVDYASPQTASEATLAAFTGRITGYVPLPWAQHHVLALTTAGGTAAGSYPRRGYFYQGGFADQDLVESFQSGLTQSAFVLRGYRPGTFGGRSYTLSNAELRFPLWNADLGVSTLPVFLRSVSGVVFADYGGAFNVLDEARLSDSLHLGTGAELRIRLFIGYFVGGSVRFGYARGFGEFAVPGGQTYMVMAGSF